MELSQFTQQFETMGISVVVVLNEDPDLLAAFELKYDIPYLMLADVESTVIKDFGLFNPDYEPGTKYYGVPYPGIFLVDSRGIIVQKFAEESYRSRPVFDDLVNAAAQLNANP